MALLDIGIRLIELALNGHPRLVLGAPGHEVNACVLLAAVIAPVRPARYLRVLIPQSRIRAEIVHHELFKSDAVLARRLVFTQLVEDVGERSHGVYY